MGWGGGSFEAPIQPLLGTSTRCLPLEAAVNSRLEQRPQDCSPSTFHRPLRLNLCRHQNSNPPRNPITDPNHVFSPKQNPSQASTRASSPLGVANLLRFPTIANLHSASHPSSCPPPAPRRRKPTASRPPRALRLPKPSPIPSKRNPNRPSPNPPPPKPNKPNNNHTTTPTTPQQHQHQETKPTPPPRPPGPATPAPSSSSSPRRASPPSNRACPSCCWTSPTGTPRPSCRTRCTYRPTRTRRTRGRAPAPRRAPRPSTSATRPSAPTPCSWPSAAGWGFSSGAAAARGLGVVVAGVRVRTG